MRLVINSLQHSRTNLPEKEFAVDCNSGFTVLHLYQIIQEN